MGHYGTGSNQGLFANRHAGQDHGPTADGGTPAHARRDHLPVRLGLRLSFTRRVRVEVVDEHHPVPDEYLVLDRHAFADEAVTGDLTTSPDHGVFLDLDKGANARVVADLTPVQIHKAMD